MSPLLSATLPAPGACDARDDLHHPQSYQPGGGQGAVLSRQGCAVIWGGWQLRGVCVHHLDVQGQDFGMYNGSIKSSFDEG
jgi:hypothetical protein